MSHVEVSDVQQLGRIGWKVGNWAAKSAVRPTLGQPCGRFCSRPSVTDCQTERVLDVMETETWGTGTSRGKGGTRFEPLSGRLSPGRGCVSLLRAGTLPQSGEGSQAGWRHVTCGEWPAGAGGGGAVEGDVKALGGPTCDL